MLPFHTQVHLFEVSLFKLILQKGLDHIDKCHNIMKFLVVFTYRTIDLDFLQCPEVLKSFDRAFSFSVSFFFNFFAEKILGQYNAFLLLLQKMLGQ